MNKVYIIRKQKVMLDNDLAKLYDTETKQLKRAVRRNINRFLEDFMFELTQKEFEALRSQFGTSSWGGTRYTPMAFTEQGVAMLSSVLNSERAILINVQIIRIFTKMREMLLTNKTLLNKMNELERKVSNQDKNLKQVFDYLRQFIKEKNEPRKEIGFKQKANTS